MARAEHEDAWRNFDGAIDLACYAARIHVSGMWDKAGAGFLFFGAAFRVLVYVAAKLIWIGGIEPAGNGGGSRLRHWREFFRAPAVAARERLLEVASRESAAHSTSTPAGWPLIASATSLPGSC